MGNNAPRTKTLKAIAYLLLVKLSPFLGKGKKLDNLGQEIGQEIGQILGKKLDNLVTSLWSHQSFVLRQPLSVTFTQGGSMLETAVPLADSIPVALELVSQNVFILRVDGQMAQWCAAY